MTTDRISLTMSALALAYGSGARTPHDVIDDVLQRIDEDRERVRSTWLHVAPRASLHAAVDRALAARQGGAPVPLLGIPFAVKDNIDVAGMVTTVACPELAYTPETSAEAVAQLSRAGAIAIGKVNLDQLATGLVGVRSPYGTPTNLFDPRMIPGGSSSGSAVAVAAGHVSFALGTDTAGSGRVPASFANVVGLKLSRGAISTSGVVPACRSLDCVSIFALTVEDACAAARACRSWDARDPYSRADAQSPRLSPPFTGAAIRLGVPRREQLTFFGDAAAAAHFAAARARFASLGAQLIEVDLEPFLEAGKMLYGDAPVAERLEASGHLLAEHPDAFVPVVRDILLDAQRFTALDAYRAAARLHALARSAGATWSEVDALLVPTAPTIYSVQDVLARPRELNANLGTYTTFANLLDMAAIAVPSGARSDGLPAGVTLLGPRGSEAILVGAGSAYHRAVGGRLGKTDAELEPHHQPESPAPFPSGAVAVVGAHLRGQPLNGQLQSLGGRLLFEGATSPEYRLYALRETVPQKPGLVRVRSGGASIQVEVWGLSNAAFGAFVSGLPRPMCIGSVRLADGRFVPGFLCEPEALEGAIDISELGGWRAYLKSLVPS